MQTRYGLMISFAFTYTLFWMLIVLVSMTINGSKIGRKTSVLFLFSVMFITVSIRCNTGSDYYNYYTMYNDVTTYYSGIKQIVTSNYQFGFTLLSYLIKKIFDNPFAIFPVVSFISLIIPAWMIKKYSPYPVLSYSILIFGGYLLMSTNIMKQILAMAIVMLAIETYLRKKYLTFTMLTVLASFFHVTSLVIFPIIACIKLIKISNKFVILGGLISLITGFFSSKILNVIIKIPLFSRYEKYFEEQVIIGQEDIKLILNAIFITCVLGVIVLVIIKFLKRYNTTNIDMFFTKIMIVAFFIASFSINFFYLLRISFFLTQFLIIYIPILLSKVANINLRRRYWNIIMVALIIFSLIFCIVSGENNYYNYSTFFSDIPMNVKDFVNFGSK